MKSQYTKSRRRQHENPLAVFWAIDHELCDPHCSACGSDVSHICIVHIGPTEIIYCDRHRVFDVVGSNLLSSWQDENESIWQQRREYLKDFTETESYGPMSKDVPAQVRTQIYTDLKRQGRIEAPNAAFTNEVRPPVDSLSSGAIAMLCRLRREGSISVNNTPGPEHTAAYELEKTRYANIGPVVMCDQAGGFNVLFQSDGGFLHEVEVTPVRVAKGAR